MAQRARPAPATAPAGFPVWGLILLTLLLAAGGAIAMMTFFGASALNAAIGAAIGAAFLLGMELLLRRGP